MSSSSPISTSTSSSSTPNWNERTHHSLSLFHQQHKYNGVVPDAFVYHPILIKWPGKSSTVLHGHFLELGHGCDRFAHNAIMDGYAKYVPVKDARQVFDEMPDRMVADWNLMVYRYWNC